MSSIIDVYSKGMRAEIINSKMIFKASHIALPWVMNLRYFIFDMCWNNQPSTNKQNVYIYIVFEIIGET